MSAEFGDVVPKIPKALIKKVIKDDSDIILDDKAAEALAEQLEIEAKEIAKHAVERAKKVNRTIVLEEDIEDYVIKHGK
ncbi:MAG: NFYB/HAP3 family transcription factor subunit [Nitrososphaeria archaeon]